MQMQPIGPFGGLNTNISQEAIDSNQSPDLLNVDISLGGKSVKKRQGYGVDTTLSISTRAVHNLYKFFDSSGNEVRLAFNDIQVNSSVNGGRDILKMVICYRYKFRIAVNRIRIMRSMVS